MKQIFILTFFYERYNSNLVQIKDLAQVQKATKEVSQDLNLGLLDLQYHRK